MRWYHLAIPLSQLLVTIREKVAVCVTVEEISAARKIQREEVGVRSGKAIVQGVRKNDSGGGGLDRPILALLMLVTFRRYARLEGK